jgi:rubredoxin
MNTELEMVQKLYEQSKSGETSTPPKQGFINWKCPKCNNKLNRKSFKAPLYAEEGGKEFANRVINDHNLAPGLYNLTTTHFTCSCGYEYIGAKLDQVEL